MFPLMFLGLASRHRLQGTLYVPLAVWEGVHGRNRRALSSTPCQVDNPTGRSGLGWGFWRGGGVGSKLFWCKLLCRVIFKRVQSIKVVVVDVCNTYHRQSVHVRQAVADYDLRCGTKTDDANLEHCAGSHQHDCVYPHILLAHSSEIDVSGGVLLNSVSREWGCIDDSHNEFGHPIFVDPPALSHKCSPNGPFYHMPSLDFRDRKYSSPPLWVHVWESSDMALHLM